MKRILIIEDDQIVSSVYKNKLVADGFQAEIANDGQSGMIMASSYRPDLILLDLMLPDLSGVEIMKQLRAQTEFIELPIIVFSNAYLTNTIKEAWKAGATKCFSKANSTPKQIIEAVHSLLDNITSSPATAAPQTVKAPVIIPTAPTVLEAGNRLKMTAEPGAKIELVTPDPSKEFASQFPIILAALRTHNQMFIRSIDETTRLQQIIAMSMKIHALTGSAVLAGLNCLARVADALEALLHELHSKPLNINPSTLRTIASSIDFLDFLFKQGSEFDSNIRFFNILVVDDELLSRRAVTHSLEKAGLQSTDVENPMAAFNLLSENAYDLVILDAEMPGMNGFELCTKLRGLPLHKKTPVIFVTILNDFEARATSTLAGANDFIAKPFLFVELALKALVFVLRGRIEASKVSV